MNIIIESTLKTLRKSQLLLDALSDETLCNTSVSPYYSSIGTHIRHILDFYDCILNERENGSIDLTVRSRNKDVETKCCYAQSYLKVIIEKLEHFSNDIDDVVIVVDDLGLGKIEMKYTYAAALSQANSHAIHHYAIINYILDRLGVKITDEDFGFNPTTPKESLLN
ncbi:hypothetical protein [Changchengzhania lutea]|uniref:hypothetical protein n=1 Tax=Changchengzhania lutea TaxID=2049305 RepID=UPI00115F2498|nr:hypothetical protein [Changchengzhania lutea]